MARLTQPPLPNRHRVLVVDDEPSVVIALKQLMEQEGHTVLTAESGRQAIELSRQNDVHLMLLDYYMLGMNGEDVVRAVRKFDSKMQIILNTGYAGERPPRVMMREIDIQAYHDKSESPEQLLLKVDTALKTYRTNLALQASRAGLQHLLQVAPTMHRMQPLTELLTGVLMLIKGLTGYSSAMMTPPNQAADESALVALGHKEDFVIQVGIGRFENVRWDGLSQQEQVLVQHAAQAQELQVDGHCAFPMVFNGRIMGVILIDRLLDSELDIQLLRLLCQQAAVAIENINLHNQATIDSLTQLNNRREWSKRLEEDLLRSERYSVSTSVLMIDLDDFKQVNDRYGHAGGDQVLRSLGGLMLDLARNSDVPGRNGGEEFVMLLPHTNQQGAMIVAERLRKRIEDMVIKYEHHVIRVTASIGVASSEAGMVKADDLMRAADRAQYLAKHNGKNQVCSSPAGQRTLPLAAPDRHVLPPPERPGSPSDRAGAGAGTGSDSPAGAPTSPDAPAPATPNLLK